MAARRQLAPGRSVHRHIGAAAGRVTALDFTDARHGLQALEVRDGDSHHLRIHIEAHGHLIGHGRIHGMHDAGLPEALLAANQEHCIRMPMRDTCRSLNLSNSVAVGVYEVLRQWDFPELLDHGHLRDYEWK